MDIGGKRFKLVIDGVGESTLFIDQDMGFFILREMENWAEYRTYVFRREDLLIVKINVEKGLRGLPNVYREGDVLYSPIEDSLVIVLRDIKSMEMNYSRVGRVMDGIDVLNRVNGVSKAKIIKI